MSEQELIQGVKRNYGSCDLTDFILVSREGKEFPVHRLVLASQSEVFATMFRIKNSKEYLSGRCEVSDVDGTTLDALLRFMHGIHSCDSDFDAEPTDLLVAAHKYQLLSVVAVCEKILVKQVRGENAGEILVLSDRYDLPVLKTAGLDCIKKHGRDFIRHGQMEVVRSCSGALLEEALACVRGNEEPAGVQNGKSDSKVTFRAEHQSGGSEVLFKVVPTTTMGKVKKSYVDRMGGCAGSYHFAYKDVRLFDKDTPASLGIKNDDELHVYEDQPCRCVLCR